MDFNPKSEYIDPHVQKHRRKAAGRPDRLAGTLAGILQKIAADLEQPVDPRISLLKDSWVDIVGKQIALHCEPQFIDKFILYILVDHPGWMAELQKIKRHALTRIQKAFSGERPIRDIRFTLAQRS
jgi:predicted nucleic acid-binding Zn ribbon protein